MELLMGILGFGFTLVAYWMGTQVGQIKERQEWNDRITEGALVPSSQPRR